MTEEQIKKIERYRKLNQTALEGKILFAGSSLMEMFPIEELVKESGSGKIVYNRGVGGFTTTDLLEQIEVCVLSLKPSTVFINIGTNDLSNPDITIGQIMENYRRIIGQIMNRLPDTKIYMMAYYPVNYEAAEEWMKPCLAVRTNEKINCANEAVCRLADELGVQYIDVNDQLKDGEGRLKAEYTIEGMHIKPEGYRAIFPDVMRYVD